MLKKFLGILALAIVVVIAWFVLLLFGLGFYLSDEVSFSIVSVGAAIPIYLITRHIWSRIHANVAVLIWFSIFIAFYLFTIRAYA